ncbi:hypothetical protein KX816_18330 [Sphingosinicellaceae bacterium]|nr:hypothetical protein KX816_18330 [Sphingosinicellaceae bacterium]
MSVVERSDARASARVLAKTAKRCIDGELEAKTHRHALNNLFRLLNAYRAHGFAGYEYQARSQRTPEKLTLMPSTDRHVVDLGVALDSALTEIYGEEDRGQAINHIDLVIRCVAKSDAPDEGERARTSRFLDAFIHRLAVH